MSFLFRQLFKLIFDYLEFKKNSNHKLYAVQESELCLKFTKTSVFSNHNIKLEYKENLNNLVLKCFSATT